MWSLAKQKLRGPGLVLIEALVRLKYGTASRYNRAVYGSILGLAISVVSYAQFKEVLCCLPCYQLTSQ
jgi:hypothetical protein